MKILILCNKSPYPPREGGPIAMNMMVEGLIHAGHTVKVLAMNTNKYHVDPKDIPESYRQKTGIDFVEVDLRIRPLSALWCLLTGRSYHLQRFISAAFKEKLTEILTGGKFDIVQFEMLYVTPYLDLVRQLSDARTVFRAHNIESLIWERIAKNESHPLKRWYLRQLVRTLACYEKSVLSRFDGIAAITGKDADHFREFAEAGPGRRPRITDIPFGIDLTSYDPVYNEPASPTLFSIGSMNWIPNLEGIRWFLESVWPDIHNAIPGLKFHIAGREIPDELKKSPPENVIIEGEVPDAAAFMRSHTLMIVPLLSGSGIRIKIIEGMAASKPIVSTTIGAEGIDCTHGKDILIADEPLEFFERISACLKDPDGARAIGIRARELVESKYNRDAIIRKLEAFYGSLGR